MNSISHRRGLVKHDLASLPLPAPHRAGGCLPSERESPWLLCLARTLRAGSAPVLSLVIRDRQPPAHLQRDHSAPLSHPYDYDNIVHSSAPARERDGAVEQIQSGQGALEG